MASHFDISDRAVRRYIQRLQEHHALLHDGSGCSLITRVREKGQTFIRIAWERLDDHGTHPQTVLGAMAALHFSTQLLAFLQGTKLGDAMRSRRDQIRSSILETHPHFEAALENMDRMFYVVPDAPKSYEGKDQLLTTIIHAIAFRRELQFNYHSASSREGWRVVQPLSLVSYRSALYLAARTPGQSEVKTYAIDRIAKLSELERGFTYPSREDYDPGLLFDGAFGIFEDRDAPITEVTLRFATDAHPWLLPVITERAWHATQRFEREPSGRLVMHLQVQSLTDLKRWIMSYGNKVEVIAPDTLRDAVRKECPRSGVSPAPQLSRPN